MSLFLGTDDNKEVVLKQLSDSLQSAIQQFNTQSIQSNIDQQLQSSNAVLQDTLISSVKAIKKRRTKYRNA